MFIGFTFETLPRHHRASGFVVTSRDDLNHIHHVS
jgi:hypothetical protein